MKLLITILLFPICWYITTVSFLAYGEYKFVWSQNVWIEGIQRMIYILWPMANLMLSAVPMIRLVSLHPTNLNDRDL